MLKSFKTEKNPNVELVFWRCNNFRDNIFNTGLQNFYVIQSYMYGLNIYGCVVCVCTLHDDIRVASFFK